MEQTWRQARALYVSSSRHFLSDRGCDRSGVRIADSANVQPGLTLLTSWWKESGDWDMTAKLIDRKGTTVHEWTVAGDSLFPGPAKDQPYIHGSHLFPDGDLLLNFAYAGTVRLNACGTAEWTLPAGNHHSIEQAADGSFWIKAPTGQGKVAEVLEGTRYDLTEKEVTDWSCAPADSVRSSS